MSQLLLLILTTLLGQFYGSAVVTQIEKAMPPKLITPLALTPELQTLADYYARKQGFTKCTLPNEDFAAIKIPNPYLGTYYSAESMYQDAILVMARYDIDAEISLDAEQQVVTTLSQELNLNNVGIEEGDTTLLITRVNDDNLLNITCIAEKE